MINRRFVSAFCLSILALASVFFEPLYATTVIALVALGLYEFFSLIEKKGIPIYKYFGTIIGIIIPLSIYLQFELTKGWELLFVTLALISLFILQFSRTQSDNAVIAISTTMFGVLYVSWLFSFMIKIRLLEHGMALAGCLLLITKGADIGAFFVGIKWGKHSLIPKISPKKTIEGVIGGIVFGIGGALASKSFLPDTPVFSFVNLVLLGIALSLLGLLGDLSESLIKRDCATKDSSSILPGMGGVLDVIDSLLFTAPAFYFYIYYYTSRVFSGPTVF
ncbi:MAG: phosphatidate cytidylyltransferase [Candidatus Omnitrophica bacterium]|nr:phosphatidate cytidylyltransferase [Candidatus Omnitrophota bacterium]MDD5574146.1 phosphatidate cytidylyltransferase [Candidatus Omnitrophota bacterium]